MIALHVHSGNLYGGIETVIATLVRETDRAAVDHHIALTFDGRFRTELRARDVPVHDLGAARLTRPGTIRAARSGLRDLITRLRPDVVVTHLPWTHAVFGPALRHGGRPVVEWVHGPIDGLIGLWARRSAPDAIICNSAHTRSRLPVAYRHIPAAVILNPVPAPPGVDVAARFETRAALATSPNDVVILQASRLEEGKGHRQHLRALARLSHVPGWTLWIIGGAQRASETAYARELETLATSLGIRDRVRFAGEQAEVARFMAAADLYCQPNTAEESFGLTFIEAMGAGLPVIASDVSGLAAIIPSTVGRLVAPPGDVGRLSAVLDELIRDAPERRRLSQAGPAHARALTDATRQTRSINEFLVAHA